MTRYRHFHLHTEVDKATGRFIIRGFRFNGTFLSSFGRNADGTLYNPHGDPEELVRGAVEDVEEQQRQFRSESAKQAAETRRKRTEKRIYQTAQQIVEGHQFGPRPDCHICGKGLEDPESIERGIGPDCWQHVLFLMTLFARDVAGVPA